MEQEPEKLSKAQRYEKFADTQRILQKFWSNLVKAELTDPKRPLKKHYLGVASSKNVQESVKDLETCVSPFGRDGIFEDGIPFYHYKRFVLSDVDQRRLQENDFNILRARFTSSEDRQIRRNWNDYCKLTGTFRPNEASDIFMGNTNQKGKRISDDPFFYAFMCRGLLHRTCAQMLRRAHTLFHSAQEEGYSRPWTQIEDNQLKDLAQTYGQQWEKIGHKMNRPRFHCYQRYQKLVQEEKVTEDDLAVKVFYTLISQRFGNDAMTVAMKDPKVIKAYEEKVKWKKIAKKTGWTVEKCKEYWEELKSAVKQCVDEQASTDPKLIKQALPEALRPAAFIYTAPRVKHAYSKRDAAEALKLFLKAEEENLIIKYKKIGIYKRLLESESLSQYDATQRRLIARHIYFIIMQCEANGLFDCFPKDKCSFYYKLEAIQHLLEKRAEKEENKSDESRGDDGLEHFGSVAAVLLDYVESKGWEPRTRTFLVHKLDGEKNEEDGEGQEEEPDDTSWLNETGEAVEFKKGGVKPKPEGLLKWKRKRPLLNPVEDDYWKCFLNPNYSSTQKVPENEEKKDDEEEEDTSISESRSKSEGARKKRKRNESTDTTSSKSPKKDKRKDDGKDGNGDQDGETSPTKGEHEDEEEEETSMSQRHRKKQQDQSIETTSSKSPKKDKKNPKDDSKEDNGDHDGETSPSKGEHDDEEEEETSKSDSRSKNGRDRKKQGGQSIDTTSSKSPKNDKKNPKDDSEEKNRDQDGETSPTNEQNDDEEEDTSKSDSRPKNGRNRKKRKADESIDTTSSKSPKKAKKLGRTIGKIGKQIKKEKTSPSQGGHDKSRDLDGLDD
uniref:Myb-like domain-containing protein n=2 Tax=Bursaphelenchus xylophilus TaxID=6326 RepID=A0A1I7SUT9_BURXY